MYFIKFNIFNNVRLAYGYYNQVPIFGSGFPTPLPFVLQQYDQIRFEGNENKVYTIMNVNKWD
jgi:hypothetical protein